MATSIIPSPSQINITNGTGNSVQYPVMQVAISKIGETRMQIVLFTSTSGHVTTGAMRFMINGNTASFSYYNNGWQTLWSNTSSGG